MSKVSLAMAQECLKDALSVSQKYALMLKRRKIYALKQVSVVTFVALLRKLRVYRSVAARAATVAKAAMHREPVLATVALFV